MVSSMKFEDRFSVGVPLPRDLLDHFVSLFRWLLLAFYFCALNGCSSSYKAAFSTLSYAFENIGEKVAVELNPNLKYLRVTNRSRVAYLALGYVDLPSGSDSLNPVEVWYSAEKEVMRLQNGRLVGLSGTPVELFNVKFLDLPSWEEVGVSKAYTVIRDEMPGYIFGKKQRVILHSIKPPKDVALLNLDVDSLLWFEERYLSNKGSMELRSIYAIDVRDEQYLPVYGEQCLTPDFCLTWQWWSSSDNQQI